MGKFIRKYALAAGCLVFLCGALVMGIGENEVQAAAGTKEIDLTACMDPGSETAGGIRGFSNNCSPGSGSCIDNGCPEGTEERSPKLR